MIGVRVRSFLVAPLVVCVACGPIGCSNNNYASRDKCKKCGRPKEETSMLAIAMHGASLPTYAHYFARAQAQELLGLRMNYGMMNGAGLQQGLPPYANWPYGGSDRYGIQSGFGWPLGGKGGLLPYDGGNGNQIDILPKDWRNGDWMCNCGFHNYASGSQSKTLAGWRLDVHELQ